MPGRTAPRALLFDFDGLICDTEAAGHQAWRELYAEYGRDFPDRLWSAMVGREDGALRAVDALLVGRYDVRDAVALLERRRLRRRELCARQPLRPGVRELLEAAARHGAPAAVVSSAPRSWVAPHLERLGVRGCFAHLVTGERVRSPKPDPEAYLLALRLLGRTAEEAVALEDSPVGVRAARAAGVHCVAVDNAAGGPADLSEADAVLPSLTAFRPFGPYESPYGSPYESPHEGEGAAAGPYHHTHDTSGGAAV